MEISMGTGSTGGTSSASAVAETLKFMQQSDTAHSRASILSRFMSFLLIYPSGPGHWPGYFSRGAGDHPTAQQ